LEGLVTIEESNAFSHLFLSVRFGVSKAGGVGMFPAAVIASCVG